MADVDDEDQQERSPQDLRQQPDDVSVNTEVGRSCEVPTHAEAVNLARELTADLEPGPPLDSVTRAIIEIAVHVSVTGLDASGTQAAVDTAMTVGATREQIREVILLVSTLGVHSLFVGMSALVQALPGSATRDDEPSSDGSSPFVGKHWLAIEEYAPGTLAGLMMLPADIQDAVSTYCALPWRGRALGFKEKELVSLALDAVPTHCYIPGFRTHLQNARQLGVGRIAILDTVEIAGAAPMRGGVR